LDTGANLNNDLKGLIVGQINLAGNNNDITDTLKHGTMVASIIGATMGDKLGVPGICPGVQLLIAKVTDSSNRTSGALLASGLQWALAQGARVINVSLGESPGGPPDENVRNAVQLAVSRGTVVVMAAGNTGSSDPTSNSMASSNDAAIRVGGARLDNSVDPGSNRGAWVDLAAPFTFPAGSSICRRLCADSVDYDVTNKHYSHKDEHDTESHDSNRRIWWGHDPSR
jgi:thermitase